MRFYCSHCGQTFEQEENLTGPNVCLSCNGLLYKPLFGVPGWVMGCLLVLVTFVFITW
jgi:DNA-directed RNA polymerase subunit RPC12/RpoP